MTMETITIRAADGDCPAYAFTPAGSGPWPGVLFFMDGLGIRQTLFDMAQRLADAGYLVLLPDLYYRHGPYPPVDVAAAFATGAVREAIGHLFATTDNHRAAADTAAFLGWFDGRADVAGPRIGVTGYCMGGAMALTVAGTYPDRIAAAASFHGGNLATDSALSPHRLAPQIKAQVYVAGADADATYPPDMAARLEQALAAAGADHRCEIYAGALHAWTMADTPVYNAQAAERHWRELLALFAATLR